MFAGLISFEQSVSNWGDLDKILTALAPYSLDKPRDRWTTDKLLLLQVATRNDATSAEIYRHTESGVAVAFWGRLDNRPDLISQLEAEHKVSDDELIALAWLKWGEHCPEKLIGDFAFAVISPRTGVVFLARDVIGVKPLYYRKDENGVFFASTAAAFKPLTLGTLTRSEKWMAEYMLGLSNSHTETAYLEIKKLQGAHSLLIHADGRINIRRYHQFVDDAPIENKRDPKYLEAYKAAWQEAVACRIPKTGPIGSENSGGLDSGSITAEIARQLGGNVDRLHGIGLCHEPLEPALIMATAMKYAISNNFLYAGSCGYDETEMQRIVLHTNGYPVEHSTALANNPFYLYCQQKGISTLHSGFGGDEVVTSNGIPIRLELLEHRNWLGLWQVLPGNLPMRFARLGKSIWQGIKPPKHNNKLYKMLQQGWKFQFLNLQSDSCYGLKELYLGAAKPFALPRSVNEFALRHLQMAYVPTRLENCTLIASVYGIDYVWPLWDQRLVQQWLSTPVLWKVGQRGSNRYLHRSAVSGVCPDSITWKFSKEMRDFATIDSQNNESIVTILNGLLQLLEELPYQLEALIDVPKVRQLALQGIKEEWKTVDVDLAFHLQVSCLQGLSSWLQQDLI